MKGLFGRLRDGLNKTRSGLRETLQRSLGQTTLSAEALDELEAALLRADVGVETTAKLLDGLSRASHTQRAQGADWAVGALREEVVAILRRAARNPQPFSAAPHVVMVVGVNGTGKTTTVGKLAWLHRRSVERVLVVSADTFRAAANEQLARWADRAGVDIVQSQSGADPAAIAFDGVKAGIARGAEVVLIDTAGRLQTKAGLMDEVAKIHRVIGKTMPGAPHETLLVLDATTGQNAIQQAREFGRRFPLTGLILAKLDGTAKGGVVVSIADTLNVPVCYLGVGESIDDLVEFDAVAFADALLTGG
jgi:fused signal recognition particle receptor